MSHRVFARRVIPALALAAASWASAESITFSVTRNVVSGDDRVFTTASGMQVVASGYESTRLDPLDVLFSDSRPVTLGASGLGVDGTGLIFSDPPDQIDGLGVDEFLLLTFDQRVTLDAVTLGKIDKDRSDNVSIWALDRSTSLVANFTQNLANPDALGFKSVNLASQNLSGTRFLFSVDGGLINSCSDYSLASVSVTAVPLPPAALAGLVLLAGAGLNKVRRSRAART